MERLVLKDGSKYEGTLSDYTVGATKAGKPTIELWFDIKGYGALKKTCFMTPATMEKTFATLSTLGLTGPIDDIANGPMGGALKIGTVVSVQVEAQKNEDKTIRTDKKGNPYFQISFVNSLKKPKHDPSTAAEGKKKLSQFAGEWMAFKKANGVKEEKPSTPSLDI
jgi:hypothetical protein